MKTIAITSGKGGVGKTNIAVNLGLALAQQGKRILLLDADLSLANVDILFGFNCPHNVFDYLEGKKELTEVLVSAPFDMKVLPSSSGVLKLERLSQAQLMKFSSDMQSLASGFDVLLIDTGAGLTENVLFFSCSADEVLVITTPEPTALTDAYAVLKLLVTMYAVPSILVLVNQTKDEREGRAVFDKLNLVARQFLNRELKLAGILTHDEALKVAVRARTPVIIHSPESSSSRQLKALAHDFDNIFSSEVRRAVPDFWRQLVEGRRVAPDPQV